MLCLKSYRIVLMLRPSSLYTVSSNSTIVHSLEFMMAIYKHDYCMLKTIMAALLKFSLISTHKVVVCDFTKLLYLHLCSMLSNYITDYLQRYIFIYTHIERIRTSNFMWSRTVQLQRNHTNRFLMAGVNGLSEKHHTTLAVTRHRVHNFAQKVKCLSIQSREFPSCSQSIQSCVACSAQADICPITQETSV